MSLVKYNLKNNNELFLTEKHFITLSICAKYNINPLLLTSRKIGEIMKKRKKWHQVYSDTEAVKIEQWIKAKKAVKSRGRDKTTLQLRQSQLQ